MDMECLNTKSISLRIWPCVRAICSHCPLLTESNVTDIIAVEMYFAIMYLLSTTIIKMFGFY